MSDNSPSAASLLDRIDLARDDSQIVRTISSILKASDYPQLVSTFQTEITQPPPEKAVKFVNALDKARFQSSRGASCVVNKAYTIHMYFFRRWDTMTGYQRPRVNSTGR